jgi:ATP adenylyltransferase
VSHEQIWAPWRLEYVTGKSPPPNLDESVELLPGARRDCFICCGVPEGDDRSRLVVDRGERTITILNRYPYNNGHLLLAPKHHLAGLDELDNETHLEVAAKLVQWIERLGRLMQPHGFNVGLNLGRVAGAGLPGHIHWHVVPRWNGDTNFMPVLAGVRVIPQSLEALWDVLAGELGRGSDAL